MIDLDLCRGVWESYRGLAIGNDALALDEIDRVGVGEGKSYLGTAHTHRHFRDAL